MGRWWWRWWDGSWEGLEQLAGQKHTLPCRRKYNLSHEKVSDTEVSLQITTRAYEMK